MSIKIDESRCIGCGRCADQCPGNLFRLDSRGISHIRDVRDCWGCTTCLKICPLNAISMYLGADIGGDGTSMIIKPIGNVLHWIVIGPDGKEIRRIDTDRTLSNRY